MSLRVLTNIPYGNACNASVIQEDEGPLVSFAADPHGEVDPALKVEHRIPRVVNEIVVVDVITPGPP